MGLATFIGGIHPYEGKELSDIQESSLIDQITLVSHNSYLFKGTVADNLRMGKP